MSNPTRTSRVRNQILHDHLQQVSREHPSSSSKLIAGLTYETAISLCSNTAGSESPDEVYPARPSGTPPATSGSSIPGGLTEEDIRRYACTPLKLDSRTQAYLRDALQKTLLSLFDVWAAGQDVQQHERVERALHLPEELQSRQAQMQTLQEDIRSIRSSITGMVKSINETHPRLERTLLHALTTFPPQIHAERTVRAEVLANTIETCLLKLSLLRYRSYAALYGFTSPITSISQQANAVTSNPNSANNPGTMSKALETTYEKLRRKEMEQREEEKRLDAQIGEYEELLSLIDGGRELGSKGGREGRGGRGFRQVVSDMATVRREMEECRKDLRRLGWTGD